MMDAAPTAFKAIETVYNGYRFRCRLEARWAVFFDTLDIKYEFEKEGFDLEGTWYLPDFWLPKQRYWIEIKGQKPTKDESKKAELLALHTAPTKLGTLFVHILSGDAWCPPAYTANTFMIPFFDLRPLTEIRTTKDYKAWIPSVEVVSLFRKMKSVGLDFHADKAGQIYLSQQTNLLCKIENAERAIRIYQSLAQTVQEILPLIEKHKKELAVIYKPITWGWTVRFVDAHTTDTECWCECTHCENVTIDNPGLKCLACGEKDAHHRNDSPRLIAAYTAARQARFEHGESGGVE